MKLRGICKMIGLITIASFLAMGFAFADNVMVGGDMGSLWVYNETLNLQPGGPQGGHGTIEAIAGLSNGTFVVGNSAGTIWLYDAGLNQIAGGQGGHGTITDISAFADGGFVVVNAQGQIFTYLSDTSIASASFGPEGGHGQLNVVATVGNKFVVGGTVGSLWLYDKAITSQPNSPQGGHGVINALAAQVQIDLPPSVEILSPEDDDIVWPPSKVTVTVDVVDEDVSTVELTAEVDGTATEIEEEVSNENGTIDLVVHLPKQARGTYTDGRNLSVEITATDSIGQTGSDEITIFVPHDMRNKKGNFPN